MRLAIKNRRLSESREFLARGEPQEVISSYHRDVEELVVSVVSAIQMMDHDVERIVVNMVTKFREEEAKARGNYHRVLLDLDKLNNHYVDVLLHKKSRNHHYARYYSFQLLLRDDRLRSFVEYLSFSHEENPYDPEGSWISLHPDCILIDILKDEHQRKMLDVPLEHMDVQEYLPRPLPQMSLWIEKGVAKLVEQDYLRFIRYLVMGTHGIRPGQRVEMVGPTRAYLWQMVLVANSINHKKKKRILCDSIFFIFLYYLYHNLYRFEYILLNIHHTHKYI